MKDLIEDRTSNAGVDPVPVMLELPLQTHKLIEATVTLGGFKSVEAFIIEAASEKAESFKLRLQSSLPAQHGGVRGRAATVRKAQK